ncbi:MAG: DUF421 domain-containing protein [Euryarchaeota archaeon]|nr:DUF421 domain-containing protein [Euryarchaeota archaeon]
MIDLITFDTLFEVVIRTALISIFTFTIVRIRGYRQLAQFSLLDVIIVIALGSAVGDVMIYSEEVAPLLKSMAAIGTLVLMVIVIESLLFKAPHKIEEIVYGKALTLIKDGKLIEKNLDRTNITKDQLRSKLRERNIRYFSETRIVRLEPDGKISVERKRK